MIGAIVYAILCLTVFVILRSAGVTSDNWQYWVIGLYIVISRLTGIDYKK